MKIVIVKDWLEDAVRVRVDSSEIGSIYHEDVALIAEVMTRILNAVASKDTEIVIKTLDLG